MLVFGSVRPVDCNVFLSSKTLDVLFSARAPLFQVDRGTEPQHLYGHIEEIRQNNEKGRTKGMPRACLPGWQTMESKHLVRSRTPFPSWASMRTWRSPRSIWIRYTSTSGSLG